MSDEFFSQAQAEMRAAELRQSARRYGGFAAAAALVVLAGVGIWQWEIHVRHQAQAVASGRYFTSMEALQAAQPGAAERVKTAKASAATLEDLAAHAPGATRGFAALRLAQLRIQEHDPEGARKAWQGVIDTEDADPALRSLARLMLLNSHIDDADPTVARKGFELMASGSGPYRALAQEGLVALDLRADATPEQRNEARRLLTDLTRSAEAPDGVRHRAQILLETLGGAG